jgi:hypothetical protein
MRIGIFGESTSEIEQRVRDKTFALREYIALQVKDTSVSGSLTPILGLNTPGWWSPSIANVGIGVKTVSGSGITELIEANTSYQNIVSKISSVPSTPKVTPSNWSKYFIPEL